MAILLLLAQQTAAQDCIYFTNQIPPAVRFINPGDLGESNPLIGEIRRDDCGPPEFRCRPQNLALNAEQTRLYYTDTRTATVSAIDLGSNEVVGTVEVGLVPQGIAVSTAGVIYVSISSSGEVAVLSADSLSVTDRIPVGNLPKGIAFSADGSTAYVAVTGNPPNPEPPAPPELAVIDVALGEVVDRITVGQAPFGVAVAPSGTVYVSNLNGREVTAGPPPVYQPTVSVIETPANEVVATIDVGLGPTALAVTSDGSQLYVANFTANTVTVINTLSNTVIDTVPVPVGSNPLAIGFSSNGASAYVLNSGNVANNISIIDTATREVLTPLFALGAGMQGLVVADFPCAVIPTPTSTPTFTTMPSPSSTPTVTGTPTPRDTDTPGPSPTPTRTPTFTPTTNPSLTRTPTATVTPTTTGSPEETPTSTPTSTPRADCFGDCDDNGVVSAAELIRGVNIALGSMGVGECSQFDTDGNGVVTIDELIAAVADATGSCA